jgi:hypothetical protein
MFSISLWAENNEQSFSFDADFQHFDLACPDVYCKEQRTRTRKIFFISSLFIRRPFALSQLADVSFPIVIQGFWTVPDAH